MEKPLAKKIKIGVSSCLLGESVRWNGGHKLDPCVKELLSRNFECVPVCPEVEVGMGVPREPVHLVVDENIHRLVGKVTGNDWTARMTDYSKDKVKKLSDLSGFIFKEASPSCGIRNIPIHSKDGKIISALGQGYFAKAFMAAYPIMPAIDEQQLGDESIREDFIRRALNCYSAKKSLSAESAEE